MKEKDFQGWIVQTAQALGWKCWHVPTPMRPVGGSRFVPDPRGRGLCDLILLHEDPPRLIFAEVKTDSDLSVEQKEFLRLARGVADYAWMSTSPLAAQQRIVGVYVWRPGNEDLIEATLRGKVMNG